MLLDNRIPGKFDNFRYETVIRGYRHVGGKRRSHRTVQSGSERHSRAVHLHIAKTHDPDEPNHGNVLQLHFEPRPRDIASRRACPREEFRETRSPARRVFWNVRYGPHGYSPIEPAMSLFPPRARILPQFRQSEENPAKRSDNWGQGERKGKPFTTSSFRSGRANLPNGSTAPSRFRTLGP